MAVGPIPFTAIVDYFNIYGLSDFDDFSYVIRRMDKVYLESNNQGGGSNKPNVKSDKKNSNIS